MIKNLYAEKVWTVSYAWDLLMIILNLAEHFNECELKPFINAGVFITTNFVYTR